MAVTVAMSVNDVFDRLQSVGPHVTSWQKINLSKRDIEFLLEYRTQMNSSSEELCRRRNEMKVINQVLTLSMDSTEDGLKKLANLSLPDRATETTTQIYQSLLLLNILRMAVKDSFGKIKNESKVSIPRDSSTTPTFYNIMRGNTKLKEFTIDKELQRATKLWLWTKKQNEKPTRPKGERKDSLQESVEEEGASVPPIVVPAKTPAPAKALRVPKTPATKGPTTPRTPKAPAYTTGNTTYQCHLLLNNHFKLSKAAPPKFKPTDTLEDKLRYLLDKVECAGKTDTKASPVLAVKIPPPVQRQSVSQQTDNLPEPSVPKQPAIPKQHKHSQTCSETDSDSEPNPLNRSLSKSAGEEVFLPATPSTTLPPERRQPECPRCVLCTQHGNKRHSQGDSEQLSKLIEESLANRVSSGSTIKSHRFGTNRQLSVISQSSSCEDDLNAVDRSLTSSEFDDQRSIHRLYHNMVKDNNNNTTTTNNNATTVKRLVRCGSAPARQSSATVRRETITALLPSLRREDKPCSKTVAVETHDRAVSALSRAYTPARRRVARVKHADTQTDNIQDPENMLPEDLFRDGDDVRDEPINETFNEYRPIIGRHYLMEADGRLFSPNSETVIMWMVSNHLNPGQWKELYRKLIYNSEHIIPEAVTNEDIESIIVQHQGDKMQAMASLEQWRQINGEFLTNILLKCLSEIRRNDIIKTVKKYLARHQNSLNMTL